MPTATQFTLLPIGRLVTLIGHYGGLHVDALPLPPDSSRLPLAYVNAILDELRLELRRREHAVPPAAVAS